MLPGFVAGASLDLGGSGLIPVLDGRWVDLAVEILAAMGSLHHKSCQRDRQGGFTAEPRIKDRPASLLLSPNAAGPQVSKVGGESHLVGRIILIRRQSLIPVETRPLWARRDQFVNCNIRDLTLAMTP